MFKYHCLNPISAVGMNKLDENYVKTENADEADVILVRSAKMHEMEFGKNLKAIARAGAGVNNIPLDKCAEEGIVVFNTPGANANGVNVATHLGMEVYGYDPYVSVDSAWRLSRSIHHATTVDEIYKECDYITIHVPALDSTKGMIDKNAISLMKEGVVILNFARDVLVNQEDIVDALVAGKVHRYVTDFPTKEIVGVKGAIVIPHLGASTEESEDNCAQMAVAEIRDFLENGNITHSVNYPDCNVGVKAGGDRITILHRNVPNMIGQFTTLLAQENQNIALMTNKSKKEYAYTVIDVDGSVSDDVVNKLESIADVLGVRVIK